MKKKILLGLLFILVIIQFFRIDKSNPEINMVNDFIKINNPPEEIATLLKTSCYDCHSNTTKYPWYSNVSPISWWVKHHIDEAREELNFSEWGSFKAKRKDHKLEEAIEELEEGEMPLNSYTWTHSEANLTAEQKTELLNWFKETRKKAKEKKENKNVLHLNNGEKWIVNIESNEGIKRMIEIVATDVEEGRISLYAAMGERLNLEIKRIFEECNLPPSDAHDQLHLFLMPLVKQARDIEEVEDEVDAMIMQKDILKYLNNYYNFFK
jgi:hypothetical protein